MGKIFVIGGGVSGLSAAIYSALSGNEVTLCEANSTVGGALGGWRRKGCIIDNCIHWLTGTNKACATFDIWEQLGVLGEGVELYYADRLYTYAKGENEVSLHSDIERTRAELIRTSPFDEKEINSLILAVKTVMQIGKIQDDAGGRVSKIQLMAGFKNLARYYGMTTGMLSKRFCSPAVSGFITAMLGEDFSSLALISVFANFCGKNGAIPKGSSIPAAERMKEKLLSLGGKILCSNPAVKINLNDGVAASVTLSDGSVYEADAVISAVSPEVLFERLLSKPIPRAYGLRYQALGGIRFSSIQGAFCCPADIIPFRGDLIFDIPIKYRGFFGADKIVLREFSHEPSFAPKGKTVLQAMLCCSESKAEDIISSRKNRREKYEEYKTKCAEYIEKIICERLPGLTGALELLDVWTPATYERYLGTRSGAYMSYTLPSGVIPKELSAKVKGVRNLFLATQWSSFVGGLPVAAVQGKKAAAHAAKYINAITRVRKNAMPKAFAKG